MFRIFALLILCLTNIICSAQLRLQKCDNKKLNPDQLVFNHFLKEGIKVVKAQYRLNPNGSGIFYDPQNLLGISEGIVLSTGNIDSIKGPNKRFGISYHFPGFDRYEDEDFVTAHENYDAIVISIEFIPSFDSICFEYCFGSEEYPEFVGSDFNDQFALYLKVKGTKQNNNIARLPNNSVVNINQVNHKKNSEYYIDNTLQNHYNKDLQKWEPANQKLFDTYEYDGFTKLLTAGANVIPGKIYQLKMIICDLNDANFDSGIFLKSKSFRSIPSKKNIRKSGTKKHFVHFDVAKSELNDSSIKTIENISVFILHNQVDSIIINGYTDSTGNEESNKLLSLKRAEQVKQVLLKHGVSDKNFRISGEGSNHPIGSNTTPEGRLLNRRVEIILLKK